MIEIKGKYNKAIIFSDFVDEIAEKYIKLTCASPVLKNSVIRIMPDVSACRGCVIGTTMTVQDAVIPSFIGKDGGCGIIVQKFETDGEINFDKLDGHLKNNVVSGERSVIHCLYPRESIAKLRCINSVDTVAVAKNFCRLGLGNHFIEIDIGEHGEKYLVVHSGSGVLGQCVLQHYQNLAFDSVNRCNSPQIKELKEEYREAIKDLVFEPRDLEEFNSGDLPRVFCWLEGADKDDYLHDIDIVQQYASLNRIAITHEIMEAIGGVKKESFECVHNYIDIKHGILHKGSVSAQAGENVIIPIHMKAGSLLGIGKGNGNFNYSAPHGAGKRGYNLKLNLDEYIEDMKGIHSATVSERTLGESPRAYKDVSQVIDYVRETVEVKEMIKPVYNFREEKR